MRRILNTKNTEIFEDILEKSPETDLYSDVLFAENSELPLACADRAAHENREELERCGVYFDAEGKPMWFDNKEIFGEFAGKLLSHYGESIRQPLNNALVEHGLPELPSP